MTSSTVPLLNANRVTCNTRLILKSALTCLIINTFYTFIMYCENGGCVPLLFRDANRTVINDSIFLRRRLYGVEFWVSFIGVAVMVALVHAEANRVEPDGSNRRAHFGEA